MKKFYVLLLTATTFCLAACSDVDNPTQDPQPGIDTEKSLSKAEAVTCGQQILDEWNKEVKSELETAFKENELTIGDYTMRWSWTIYGEKPQDGYALYISLHGGGFQTDMLNDFAWETQKMIYTPDNGVYLCPRSIADVWNMHFLPETDEFYHKIIIMATVFLDVNPDKVYLMGYSAGGDGVWRLAPRMADYWAAASMMAGHPGDVSLVNLRNTPFSIWCGADDTDYDRNLRCAERIEEMKALHEADPDGYIYEGHILAGYDHWMDQKDAPALDWMALFKRNPYPKRVVWQQEEVLHDCFYWLTAPADELQRGKKVIADIVGNTIELSQCDYSQLTLSLCDKMLDLDKPVKVTLRGQTLFEGKVERKRTTLKSTLYKRNDPSYMFPAQIQIQVKEAQ